MDKSKKVQKKNPNNTFLRVQWLAGSLVGESFADQVVSTAEPLTAGHTESLFRTAQATALATVRTYTPPWVVPWLVRASA